MMLQCSDADSLCLAVSEDVSDVNCYCPNGKVIIDDDDGDDDDGGDGDDDGDGEDNIDDDHSNDGAILMNNFLDQSKLKSE